MRATHNEIRKIIRKKNSNAVSPLIRDLNAIIARTVAVTYLSKGKRSKELMTTAKLTAHENLRRRLFFFIRISPKWLNLKDDQQFQSTGIRRTTRKYCQMLQNNRPALTQNCNPIIQIFTIISYVHRILVEF